MRRPILLALLLTAWAQGALAEKTVTTAGDPALSAWQQEVRAIYREARLAPWLDVRIFEHALNGYAQLEEQGAFLRDSLITIIDYSAPSTKTRLYVIDLRQRKLIFHSLVAHGRNSGGTHARRFSNRIGSLQSCLGFFVTGTTYHGKHGYSLRLEGLEPRINDNARKRHIVMHGADYVSKEYIARHRQLGRSWGCPALPKEASQAIIDTIQGGSCLFIYGDDAKYRTTSRYVSLPSSQSTAGEERSTR